METEQKLKDTLSLVISMKKKRKKIQILKYLTWLPCANTTLTSMLHYRPWCQVSDSTQSSVSMAELRPPHQSLQGCQYGSLEPSFINDSTRQSVFCRTSFTYQS